MPGLTYMGSQGNNYAYTNVTFAENEERSPWEPFHVQHGFKPTDSTVSAFTGCRSTSFTLGLREKHWREHTRHMLLGMDAHNAPTLLLDPLTAQQFIDRGGFTSKEKLIDWLYDNARLPASEYWDYQLIQNYIYPRATFGEEPWASQLKALPEELIPMFRREDIHVVVVGGETNGYWRIMGCNYQKTVSVDAVEVSECQHAFPPCYGPVALTTGLRGVKMMAGWTHIKCLTRQTLGFSTHKAKENPMRRRMQWLVVVTLVVHLMGTVMAFAQSTPGASSMPGKAGAAAEQGKPGMGAVPGKAALVNINTADETQLTALQGIGPTKAKAITQYRQEHGPFKSVDDLKKVSGIGEQDSGSAQTVYHCWSLAVSSFSC